MLMMLLMMMMLLLLLLLLLLPLLLLLQLQQRRRQQWRRRWRWVLLRMLLGFVVLPVLQNLLPRVPLPKLARTVAHALALRWREPSEATPLTQTKARQGTRRKRYPLG